MSLELIDVSDTKHGKLLLEKASKDPSLVEAYKNYVEYRKSIDDLHVLDENSVKTLVEATNIYRRKVINIFEGRKNSGQEGLRSTILEEFFYHLFKDLVIKFLGKDKRSIVLGKANSYVSLSFSPKSFGDLFDSPAPYIHTKDQDFLVGCRIDININPLGSTDIKEQSSTVIPVLAIECKTYIERNMLDSCASTASRLKNAMPYCLYIVASEYMKMNEAYPELTDIDEVFILCKASNSKREEYRKRNLPPHEINQDLVIELFDMVLKHFNRVWWEPSTVLERGRIIGRP